MTSSRKHALVGLSGGVDSAVAALLLLEQGCRVTGVTMSVYDGPKASGRRTGGCYDCGEEEDIALAADMAAQLGIAHHIFGCAEQYRNVVLAYFRKTYLEGKTPNPCIRCNALVKFGLLPALAKEAGLEFDLFATGHYARAEYVARYGKQVLLCARDTRKDQSYFLYRLTQEQIDRAFFPLGCLTKAEVRRLAAARGLPVHDKPDSQNFYAGDYAELVNAHPQQGNIVTVDGTVLGSHMGYWRFTLGQRKGLGVAAKTPLYVLRIDPSRNEVVVGEYGESLRLSCIIGDMRRHIPLEQTDRVLMARLRSTPHFVPVTVDLSGDASGERCVVTFAEPQAGVAPGQSLVLYCDNVLVGGGIIGAD